MTTATKYIRELKEQIADLQFELTSMKAYLEQCITITPEEIWKNHTHRNLSQLAVIKMLDAGASKSVNYFEKEDFAKGFDTKLPDGCVWKVTIEAVKDDSERK